MFKLSRAKHRKDLQNYVMRWREQSQKSMSMARSCLDSSVSLFRHSMKSLRPPWGPSSQMKAHSLGNRSSRCVKPEKTTNRTGPRVIVIRYKWMTSPNIHLLPTSENLEAYLCECGQSSLVEDTDAAHFLNFSRVDSLPSDWFQNVSHWGRFLKSSLKKILRKKIFKNYNIASNVNTKNSKGFGPF